MSAKIAEVILEAMSKLLTAAQLFRYHLRMKRLVARGLVVGRNVTIQYSAQIDDVYPYLIRIGDNCSIANEVRILAHDATPYKFTGGYTRLGKVDIKENCFISERSIILPGVTIGPNALVAAGSVVNRDVPPNACVAGIPARVFARFDEFLERQAQQIAARPIFEHSELYPDCPEGTRQRVWEAVQDGDAYLRGYVGKYPFTLNNP